MANYLYQGSSVQVFSKEDIDINEALRAGIYTVQSSQRGLFLEKYGDSLLLPWNIYGPVNTITTRVINTFMDRKERNVNTGVLLSGVKGSGKTIQAKHIAQTLNKNFNIPIIMVNRGFDANMLAEFLSSIDTQCCVLFDEFEKNFTINNSDIPDSTAAQNGFLTMLDGTNFNVKLFILTCNDSNKINKHLLNRPSRIYYHYKFSSIDDVTLEDYMNNNLKNLDFKEDIKLLKMKLSESFTFDILQTIVEESNRYNEKPSSFLNILNLHNSIVQGYMKFVPISLNKDIKILYVEGRNRFYMDIDRMEEGDSDMYEIFVCHNQPTIKYDRKDMINDSSKIVNIKTEKCSTLREDEDVKSRWFNNWNQWVLEEAEQYGKYISRIRFDISYDSLKMTKENILSVTIADFVCQFVKQKLETNFNIAY